MSAITVDAIFPTEYDARFEMNATLEAPSRSRALVEDTLIGWELRHLIPEAKLVASELVTNAAIATPDAEICLLLAQEADAVLIGVWDSSPILPKKRPCGPDSTSGWGLHIVTAIADHTDTFPTTDPRGKITWARLAT
jgi:anti-sigma regulatory factor (Ser/Thr protein kinase)